MRTSENAFLVKYIEHRTLMMIASSIGIFVYVLFFIEKLVHIITDAKNISIGGSSFEGFSQFGYAIYVMLAFSLVLILVAQLVKQFSVNIQYKKLNIAIVTAFSLYIVIMVFFALPPDYLNKLFLGYSEDIIEAGALTVNGMDIKRVGDYLVSIGMHSIAIVALIVSLYLLQASYKIENQSFELSTKRILLSPIIIGVFFYVHMIILTVCRSLYYDISSTTTTRMITYFIFPLLKERQSLVKLTKNITKL